MTTYISAATNYDRTEVFVWERHADGTRHRISYPAPYYFFIPDPNGDTLDVFGNKLSRLDFNDYEHFNATAQRFKDAGEKLCESDISPEYKILSREYYGKEIGKLNTTFFDIEVDYDPAKGFAGPENPYAPISAISFYHQHFDKSIVYAVPPDKSWTMDKIPQELRDAAEIVLCKDERQLLTYMLAEFEDSDIISGWNSEGYDVPYIYERLKTVFGVKVANRLSFDGARSPKYKEVKDKNGLSKQVLAIHGRIHIDYMQLFFKFEPGERDAYSLEAVADDELEGLEKLEYEGSLYDLYHDDFVHFLRYNVRDTEILKGFEDKKGYMGLSVLLSHMDAAQIQDVIGTIKLTELSIINYCHFTLNRRVPDTNRDIDPSSAKFKGADVLTPLSGLHDWTASIDVNSLYPSAMRSVNISPETLVGQFKYNQHDFQALREREDKTLVLYIGEEESMEMTTHEWADYLRENKYSVSGFGTVFDQKKQGMIPALLTQWFAERKRYKKMAAEEKDLATKMKAAGDPEYKKHQDLYKYYDQVQNIFKLKLNSTYGACGNRHFKFFDVRLAESTTRTGINFLYHMARTIGLLLEGDYSYPNDSVIYGDTDSCYFKTHGLDVKEAQQIADIVAAKINASFPVVARDAFFCTEGYDNLMAVSQETVAKKAIFTNAKKSYMLYILRKDGRDTDEIKVTGMQIKKTSVPRPLRIMFTSVLEDFLRDGDWDKAGMRLLEAREAIMKSDDLSLLGLPKKVKNFEDYVSRFNMGEAGLRVPGHVTAGMLWNKCLSEYADKESYGVVSGMRLRIFYLTKKVGRFHNIAIPAEQKHMPEWFTKHFVPIIDKEGQAKRLINGPLKSILLAIDKKIPTRKTLLIEELFS